MAIPRNFNNKKSDTTSSLLASPSKKSTTMRYHHKMKRALPPNPSPLEAVRQMVPHVFDETDPRKKGKRRQPKILNGWKPEPSPLKREPFRFVLDSESAPQQLMTEILQLSERDRRVALDFIVSYLRISGLVNAKQQGKLTSLEEWDLLGQLLGLHLMTDQIRPDHIREWAIYRVRYLDDFDREVNESIRACKGKRRDPSTFTSSSPCFNPSCSPLAVLSTLTLKPVTSQ